MLVQFSKEDFPVWIRRKMGFSLLNPFCCVTALEPSQAAAMHAVTFPSSGHTACGHRGFTTSPGRLVPTLVPPPACCYPAYLLSLTWGLVFLLRRNRPPNLQFKSFLCSLFKVMRLIFLCLSKDTLKRSLSSLQSKIKRKAQCENK